MPSNTTHKSCSPAHARLQEESVPSHLQRRKNCAWLLSGSVTCQFVFPTRTGAFVRVTQFEALRLEVLCTEKPAFARGQLSTTRPALSVAFTEAVVFNVWFGPNKSEAMISSGASRP